jgi:prepilin-type N-terminal cleavage/methylation domain-containing protein
VPNDRLVTNLRRSLRLCASHEGGYTLVELLAVIAVLSLVLLGITSLYLAGVRTQSKLTSSLQAQSSLHMGLDRMRADVHVACSVTAQSATSVTVSDPPCDGSNLVTWCTQGSGSSYVLDRVSGSSCSGGAQLADSLTSGSIFSYLGPNSPAGSNALPRVHVDVTLNATPSTASTRYRVVDDLVLRNGVRQ